VGSGRICRVGGNLARRRSGTLQMAEPADTAGGQSACWPNGWCVVQSGRSCCDRWGVQQVQRQRAVATRR
jgi:hypothetical protein